MLHSFRSLSARLVCSCPADRPLGFGAWRQRGRGIEYVRSRGSDISRGSIMIYYLWFFMCDTLLCIHVYFHALNYIRVIVIFMWYVWYLCDMWHVCSLLWSLYMSCHFIMLIWFASAFYSDSNEFYFLYSCLFHIYWVHHVGLGHIRMPNASVLIIKSLYEPNMLKTSSLSYTRGCIVINHQKRGDWKHLGP